MANKSNPKLKDSITSVIAREDNDNIQITFSVPWETIQSSQEETVKEFAKDIEIPGFRKGTAPLTKVKEKISQQKLIEHSLGHLLPKALADAIKDHDLKIAIYPKFELISANPGETWQIKGTTCEIPQVELGDYKKEVSGALRSDNLIVPGKETGKEKTKEEKEGVILKALLNTVKINIPGILIQEEVDSRLSGLLSRLEKLGLALENYLNSISKSADDLRAEYAVQAKEAISIDLILNNIAEKENIKVDPKELASALSISQSTNPTNNNSIDDQQNRERLLESILKRRKALDFLLSLA